MCPPCKPLHQSLKQGAHAGAPLRNANDRRSSKVAVNCESVQEWTRNARPYGQVTRLPFPFSTLTKSTICAQAF